MTQTQWDQIVAASKNVKRVTRLTPEQKRAVDEYEFRLREEDRYLGSVFVTPEGQRHVEARTREAFLKAEALGVGYLC